MNNFKQNFFNSLKVGWFPLINFSSVFLLSRFESFDDFMILNVLFLFLQGIINVVIIQPLLVSKSEYKPSWENLFLLRLILFFVILIDGTIYSLAISSVILFDTYSKLSNNFSFKLYIIPLVFVLLFAGSILYKFDFDLNLFSLFFLIGGIKYYTIFEVVKTHIFNAINIFYNWFYSSGYLIVLLLFIDKDFLSSIRIVQVYFGFSAMLIGFIEYTSLKNKNILNSNFIYIFPILIALVMILFNFDYRIVITYMISYVLSSFSLQFSLYLKSTNKFNKINRVHLKAFLYQIILIVFGFGLIKFSMIEESYYVLILIICPNLIYYFLIKNEYIINKRLFY